MQRDLESGALIGLRLGVGQLGRREDVGGRAHAFPVRHRAVRRAVGLVGVELPRRPAVAVVVAGEHDGRLAAARQVPEARQRRAVEVHLRDEVGQQALLLVGLRDRDLAHVQPVAEEQVVGADRLGLAVALLPCPGDVALARADHRAREVVGECGGLPAGRPHAAQGDGGGGGRRVGVGVQPSPPRWCGPPTGGPRCRGTASCRRRCPRPGRRRSRPRGSRRSDRRCRRRGRAGRRAARRAASR